MADHFASLSRGSSAGGGRVLLLLSGQYNRPDGLSAFLRQRGLEVDLVDCDLELGGREDHNILDDALLTSLLQLVRTGAYPESSSLRHGGAPTRLSDSIRMGLPLSGTGLTSLGGQIVLVPTDESYGAQTRSTAALPSSSGPPKKQAPENPADRGNPQHPLLFRVAELVVVSG